MSARAKPYLGLNAAQGIREVFRSVVVPTANAFPQYRAIIGPFRTLRGAEYMRDFGYGSSCLNVEQAEELALRSLRERKYFSRKFGH